MLMSDTEDNHIDTGCRCVGMWGSHTLMYTSDFSHISSGMLREEVVCPHTHHTVLTLTPRTHSVQTSSLPTDRQLSHWTIVLSVVCYICYICSHWLLSVGKLKTTHAHAWIYCTQERFIQERIISQQQFIFPIECSPITEELLYLLDVNIMALNTKKRHYSVTL